MSSRHFQGGKGLSHLTQKSTPSGAPESCRSKDSPPSTDVMQCDELSWLEVLLCPVTPAPPVVIPSPVSFPEPQRRALPVSALQQPF